MELLTGLGLASSAGLNAYIPLLMAGVLARYTDWFPLGAGWEWLANPAVLIVLGVLLAVEFLADKIPGVDSVNDVLQTVIRPTAGGITFGAGASTLTAADPVTTDTVTAAAAGGGEGTMTWVFVIVGAIVALLFHTLKALVRPLVNTVTVGIGAPVASVVEDVASFFMAALAILLPLLIVLLIPLIAMGGVLLLRRGRRRRAERAATA
ncbi:DUF4126 domain-containing protein [Nocardiopsis ansamitocini]|uniref:Membrane protein n=1 Tax=Nocardiopsis ansamitocini TaxID=1670832 RepID=A0A9W6P2S9_9ACTN|nr:DUF4126 domain-containing protein [Nocardiopsis ansamitocini]GLU46185.1 membrane protein [Nocardiopsis ansamitocini]